MKTAIATLGMALTLPFQAYAGWFSNDPPPHLVMCEDYTDAGTFWKLVSVNKNSDGYIVGCAWYAPETGETRQRTCDAEMC